MQAQRARTLHQDEKIRSITAGVIIENKPHLNHIGTDTDTDTGTNTIEITTIYLAVAMSKMIHKALYKNVKM